MSSVAELLKQLGIGCGLGAGVAGSGIVLASALEHSGAKHELDKLITSEVLKEHPLHVAGIAGAGASSALGIQKLINLLKNKRKQ